jgi:hypothetical protein
MPALHHRARVAAKTVSELGLPKFFSLKLLPRSAVHYRAVSTTDSDGRLLAAYVNGSQDAFAQLVRRHSDFVYSAALRQVHDPHLAEDVTQAVFILLSKKASSLKEETQIMGWLFNVARYASLNALR